MTMSQDVKEKAIIKIMTDFRVEYDYAMSVRGQCFVAALRKLTDVCEVPIDKALLMLEKEKCMIDAMHNYADVMCVREINPES